MVQAKRDAGSMRDRLIAYRKEQNKSRITEQELLRDILYILQGIDGKYVHFSTTRPTRSTSAPLEGSITIVSDLIQVPQPTRDLLHRIAELGWLYRKINDTITAESTDKGLIVQSLHSALQKELTEYYKLIAVLEAQMSKEAGLDGKEELVDVSREEELSDITGLTLKRTVVWTEDMRLRMRMMGVLVEGGERERGGALVSLIHAYTSHGDPFIRTFTDQLLESVSKPFFAALTKWIYQGELHDPFDEFFVQLNPEMMQQQKSTPWLAEGEVDIGLSAEQEPVDGHEVWQKKFLFRQVMLPKFVNDSFGKKIFSTGKSLNFIKYSCQDADWVTEHQKNTGSGKALMYSDINGLEHSIDDAYSRASQRLYDVFLDKFRLLLHLRALKDYLMLGRGDFVELLMESIAPSLSRPANTLFRHNLTATLETAIRGSSSSTDHPDVLRRLDARMIEYSGSEIGWECFALDYKVDAPVDTVLDPQAMTQYMRMFNQLWRIKRVEVAVDGAWRRVMTGERSYIRDSDLNADFHKVRIALSEMIHFIRQLQAFCHLDVIECSWQAFEQFIAKKEGDLDGLVEAHRAYLDRLILKALLLSPHRQGKEESLLKHVREAFELILTYCDIVDSLCNFALSEANRKESARDVARGLPVQELPRADPETLPHIQRRLAKYAAAFQENIVLIVTNLAVHSDLDVRFLSVRLNFSLSYVLTKKSKK